MKTLPCLLLLAALTPAAQADALQSLRDTLTRLSAATPLRGQLQAKVENRTQDGDEADTRQGNASIAFDDGPAGLRLHFPHATMAQAQREELGRAQQAKASTPTATGLQALDFEAVRDMTRAAESLLRDLRRATLKSERMETWQGQNARLLVIDIPQLKPDKYIKRYENTLELWLDAEGRPLGARQQTKAEGRAFVVVSFELSNLQEQSFSVVGERLVTTRRVVSNSGSGAGQKGSGKREYLLTLAPQG